MQPNLIVNWPAIFVATIAGFVIGGIWYGPLFSKPWAKAMGMSMDKKPDPKVMRKAFALQFLGLFLTSYVLTFSAQVWRPSVWGLGADAPNYVYGICGAVFSWVGFYIPLQFGKISWEMRPWKLFWINVGHDLVTLLTISQILAYWR